VTDGAVGTVADEAVGSRDYLARQIATERDWARRRHYGAVERPLTGVSDLFVTGSASP
jgi:hypothetical protein